MKKRLKRVLLGLSLLFGAVYVCDYASVRYRIPRNREPFGVAKIQTYYAILKKDGKTEYVFNDPEDEVCVRSLFPHFACRPCWYAERRNLKRIDI